jgi:radical SAM/Cys-rich protein
MIRYMTSSSTEISRLVEAPPTFEAVLRQHALPPLRRGAVRTVQVNATAHCNLACHHCHVESGPNRTEAIPHEAVGRILELLRRSPRVECLDLTGGAPELYPHFRELVAGARGQGLRVIDRCNLTVLYLPGQEDLAEFLAAQRVDVVASLPCYTKENVEQQRGKHVFDRSIDALRWLNRLGYGRAGSGLQLDLAYNPLGASLPPPQTALEVRYREELHSLFGIEFGNLFAITNMPIKRFLRTLEREGKYEEYMSLLVNHFNPATLDALMCRSMVSVGWDGSLYDCDFNQALALPVTGKHSIWNIESFEELADGPIITASHCFGCTAGAGSSCGGTLTPS